MQATLRFAALALLAAGSAACGATADPGAPERTPASPLTATAAAPSPSPRADGESAVLLVAGDIGNCDGGAALAVAALAASQPGVIAVAGDVAARDGSAADYAGCVEPAWGALKSRIRPAPGNHDYGTGTAAGYFDYFGAAAGTAPQSWYSYQLRTWHIIALDSNCGNIEGGCGPGSPQYRWLQQDLAANRAVCTLAYWHHPRFTSGLHGNTESMAGLWSLLVAAGADVAVNGHDQHYERFAPLDAAGAVDRDAGVRAFIAGTGGADLLPVLRPAPGSEVRDVATHGLLRFDLDAGAYRWQFLAADGAGFTDSGYGTCH